MGNRHTFINLSRPRSGGVIVPDGITREEYYADNGALRGEICSRIEYKRLNAIADYGTQDVTDYYAYLCYEPTEANISTAEAFSVADKRYISRYAPYNDKGNRTKSSCINDHGSPFGCGCKRCDGHCRNTRCYVVAQVKGLLRKAFSGGKSVVHMLPYAKFLETREPQLLWWNLLDYTRYSFGALPFRDALSDISEVFWSPVMRDFMFMQGMLRPDCTFMWLTRNPAGLANFMTTHSRWRGIYNTPVMANLVMGVSICDQAEADLNIAGLHLLPVLVKIIYVRPQLGPVVLPTSTFEDKNIVCAVISGNRDPDKVRGADRRNIDNLYNFINTYMQCANHGMPAALFDCGNCIPVEVSSDGRSAHLFGDKDAQVARPGNAWASALNARARITPSKLATINFTGINVHIMLRDILVNKDGVRYIRTRGNGMLKIYERYSKGIGYSKEDLRALVLQRVASLRHGSYVQRTSALVTV